MIEAAVAVGILIVVAAASEGSTTGTGASTDATTVWSRTGIPTITALVGDVDAMQSDLKLNGSVPAGTVASSRADLARAQTLSPPPLADGPAAWSYALDAMSGALTTLDVGQRPLSSTSATHVESELESAAQQLLVIADSLRR